MIKLGRWWDWLLPGLINLDPTLASAYRLALVEDQASLANAVRHAQVSDAPGGLGLRAISGTLPSSRDLSIRQPAWIQRRPAATLILANFRGSDVSRVSTRTPS